MSSPPPPYHVPHACLVLPHACLVLPHACGHPARYAGPIAGACLITLALFLALFTRRRVLDAAGTRLVRQLRHHFHHPRGAWGGAAACRPIPRGCCICSQPQYRGGCTSRSTLWRQRHRNSARSVRKTGRSGRMLIAARATRTARPICAAHPGLAVEAGKAGRRCRRPGSAAVVAARARAAMHGQRCRGRRRRRRRRRDNTSR